MARYIFITGGVVSSLGKGLMAASLAALLQARGYKVRIRKFDPYLNVDPGTMSPYQHGEVTSPTTGPRPISTWGTTNDSPGSPRGRATTSPRGASTSRSSRASGAAIISGRPSRLSRT